MTVSDLGYHYNYYNVYEHNRRLDKIHIHKMMGKEWLWLQSGYGALHVTGSYENDDM